MAKATPKKDAPKFTYSVLSPLKFDGDRYEPGETVEMSDADAQELVIAGVLQAPAQSVTQ